MKEKYLKSLIVIVVIIIGGLFIYQNISKENKPLPEVKLKEIINKDKSFAIMIQENSETDKYQEYSSNTWPGDDYVFKEAKCIDSKGDEIKEAVTYEEGKITLTTNKTVYCTVYFDKSIIGKLRENEELANKDNLSKDLQGGMYRYQGTDDVHNWICFGTSDLSECTNETDSDGDSIPDGIDKYMYRIIGVTKDGQLYLLKETLLKEVTSQYFTWNNKYATSGEYEYTCDNKICPEWNTSLLFKRINGISNGTTQGTGTTSDNANTDIFVDSAQYDYLKSGDSNSDGKASKWYNLIANHDWMYGDIGDIIPLNTYKGQPLYEIETGNADVKHYVRTKDNITQETYKWSQKVSAKISLMYFHDYYYSYYDGSLEESRGNAGSYSKLANSWLFFKKDGYKTSPTNEWLSTRCGIYSENDTDVRAYSIYNNGQFHYNGVFVLRGVRPVFYLNSSAKIADGSGTKTDPYILDVQE